MPDASNYYWIDSDESDDHDFYWIDIDNIGSQVWFEDNDESVGPFDIGFEFPFYGENHSALYLRKKDAIALGTRYFKMRMYAEEG